AYADDAFGVDSAFDLVGVTPAAGPLVLVLDHRPRARHAADRRVADVVQRVVRDLVDMDVGVDPPRVPVDERLDLPDAVALAPLGPLRVGTRQALLAPDSGDPGGERPQRRLERLHLADVAAAVRIAFPEIRPFLPVLLGDREHLGPDQLEPVALDQPLARLVR